MPPSPPSLPTGHQRRFYWKHRGTRPCHAGMAVARLRPGCGWVLLSSLSLYWLLLPSDIQPFSFLQAVTAFQGQLRWWSPLCVRLAHRVSPTGTAPLVLPGASHLPQGGEDRHRLLTPAAIPRAIPLHTQLRFAAHTQPVADLVLNGTQPSGSASKQPCSTALCCSPCSKSSLKAFSSLNAHVPTAPVAP